MERYETQMNVCEHAKREKRILNNASTTCAFTVVAVVWVRSGRRRKCGIGGWERGATRQLSPRKEVRNIKLNSNAGGREEGRNGGTFWSGLGPAGCLKKVGQNIDGCHIFLRLRRAFAVCPEHSFTVPPSHPPFYPFRIIGLPVCKICQHKQLRGKGVRGEGGLKQNNPISQTLDDEGIERRRWTS